MKSSRYVTLVLAVAALTATGYALPFGPPIVFDVQPDNPAATQAAARTVLNDTDLIDCFRADGLGTTVVPGVGTFVVAAGSNIGGPTYNISWSLTAGMVIGGIYVKGGSQGGNFYGEVPPDEGTTVGSVLGVHTPVTGGSGQYAELSHLDFFCEPAAVPDNGSALMLLSMGFSALELLRRKLFHSSLAA